MKWRNVLMVALTALVTLLAILAGWVLYLGISGKGVSNEDILHEMRAQSCILSLPLEERTEEAQAECRQLAGE